MPDHPWPGAIRDVDDDHPGVAPCGIRDVTVHDRVMKAISARRRPRRYLAGFLVHSGNPKRPASRGLAGSAISTVMKM